MKRGAREQNPVLGGIAHRPGFLIPVKVGSSVATLYLIERLQRKNRVAAFTALVTLNAAYFFVVQHNYRVKLSQPAK